MSTSFRKPRRNFRKKITVDSESEDEKQEVIDVDNDQNDNKPQIFSDEKKQKKKKKDKESQEMGMHRTSSVLSFNEDQEEGTVTLKKELCGLGSPN